MKKNLYYLLYIGVLMMFLAGCQDEGMFTPDSHEPFTVRYTVKVDDGVSGRAIGDGTMANNLTVAVFDEDGNFVSRQDDLSWEEVQGNGLGLTLFKGEYSVLFWLQYADDKMKPYSIDNEGQVSVSYDGWTGKVADMEQWDAFYLVDALTINNEPQTKDITLTRPLGQLNWADDTLVPSDEEHQVVVSLTGAVTSFNPFEQEATEISSDVLTFAFGTFPTEKLEIGDEEYSYLSCSYLFPATLSATFDLQKKDGTSLKLVESQEARIETNKRTNVLGSTVLEPETPETGGAWDGVTMSEPEYDGEHYIINQPSDLAWLASVENVQTLTGSPIFKVVQDIDMNCTEATDYTSSSLQLPEGSVFMGDNHTISNLSCSLFGNATNLTVQNLTLDNVVATTEEGHVGVLVNTLTGSSTFTGVTITNSSATTTNGAAGGMVGKIVRKDETSREEELTVTFSNCDLTNVTANGTESEGKFVGLFSGYDNQETLSFDADCSATNITLDYESPYKKENQSVWIAEELADTYDSWLGTETYRRGVVKFADVRLVPKWDGKHAVEPIAIADNCYEVYSPFDLAGVRAKTASPTAIYLKADIDMNGQGEDGIFNVPDNFTQSAYTSTDDNIFEPFSSVITLDGKKSDTENYSIYNLSISKIREEKAAFILSASGTTTHKNINFRNCQTVAVHKEVETDAKAYGAILVSNVEATYTMENVHAYDCRVFALQKVGTLGARIAGTSTLLNNSVNNCYVENYECNIPENFESGWKDIDVEFKVYTVNCYSSFFPHGEIGGMFGFIQGNSNISNCHVNKIKINAFGQNDKEADFDIKDMDDWKEAGLIVLAKTFTGLYLVPGRHVGTLIGDIRATGTITITDSGVSDSQCLNRQDKHNDTYDYLGQCYYVKFLDSEGSVTVDGNKLTLANCNRNTKR